MGEGSTLSFTSCNELCEETRHMHYPAANPARKHRGASSVDLDCKTALFDKAPKIAA